MRGAAASGRYHPVRPGFTLFELVVALVVMSAALALVGPAILPRHADASESFASLLSDSRRTANRRAQAMQLDVDQQGGWTLSKGMPGQQSIVRTGHTPPLGGVVRIRISPIGICVANSSTAVMVDPLTCASARKILP